MNFWQNERMNTFQKAIHWIGERYDWTDNEEAERELFKRLNKIDMLILNEADIERIKNECRKLCLFVRRNFNKKGVQNGNKQVY
ncbi:hypothetical protein [Deferribacter abyssi]|uniref:hypothetical protein n=1 Tax=Deferribacter abyssi TaxID=213806 RepID=UPI003C24C827